LSSTTITRIPSKFGWSLAGTASSPCESRGAGIRIVNSLPRPTPSLRALKIPPSISTSRRASASPMPKPECLPDLAHPLARTGQICWAVNLRKFQYLNQ
jgi:hypothetical protein